MTARTFVSAAVVLVIVAAAGSVASAAFAAGVTAPPAPVPASVASSAGAAPGTPAAAMALVTGDAAVLRAAPREAATQQAQLAPGELLEIRGERQGYVQVWDHQRERGGFVKASQVRRLALAAAEAPELLAVARFHRDTPGAESLVIGLAAAYLQAAPAEAVRGDGGIDALDAIGSAAERLARRASAQQQPGASSVRPAQAALAAQLDVAAQYGVKFASYEQESGLRVCYEGDAFRRVLALLGAKPEQKARAALALTDPACTDPALTPAARHRLNAWRADVLDRVEVRDLSPAVRNRVVLRRASVWSAVAYGQARVGEKPQAAAQRAVDELARVDRAELGEDDAAAVNEAAMRVNASRWAALPDLAPLPLGVRPAVRTVAGAPGETCVLLVDEKHDERAPLARRCTYGLVWSASASVNREANAVTLAVQPLEAWRELWLFRRQGAQWTIDVLPPAPRDPALGYAEFAGWVPGGREMLVAREARSEGKWRRTFEVVSLDSLGTQRQSNDAEALGPFQRWADAGWRRMSVAVR